MIARVWRGVAGADTADTYVEHLKTNVFPALREIDGYRDVHLLRRDLGDRVAFVVITMWTSMEAIKAFAGDDVERAVVPAEARALLTDYEETVEHFERIGG